jgi:hypothetical protein
VELGPEGYVLVRGKRLKRALTILEADVKRSAEEGVLATDLTVRLVSIAAALPAAYPKVHGKALTDWAAVLLSESLQAQWGGREAVLRFLLEDIKALQSHTERRSMVKVV